jgi:hypothetical protein
VIRPAKQRYFFIFSPMPGSPGSVLAKGIRLQRFAALKIWHLPAWRSTLLCMQTYRARAVYCSSYRFCQQSPAEKKVPETSLNRLKHRNQFI